MRRRSLSYVTAPFQVRHWRSLRNIPITVRRPVGFLARYVTGRGEYPAEVKVRTPTGVLPLAVYCADDIATVNEVFCRLDYRVSSDIRTVLDIGANIGISAAYFLSRNPAVRVTCFEPAPANLPRLRAQLEQFGDRAEIQEYAVATADGDVEFGVEPTGRYGSMYIPPTHERIVVPCRSINGVLEDALGSTDRIDVLKLDTEGLEPATIEAIRPDLAERIGLVVFEGLDGAVNRLGARKPGVSATT
ncbi:MAG: FkbM family methyltransferase [Thermoleophilaceae bacterium]